MKSKFLYSAVIVAAFMFVNFSGSQVYGQTAPGKTVKQKNVQYTCPMHPEVVQNIPGNCPKCGSKLVEKKEMKTNEDMLPQTSDTTMRKFDKRKPINDTTVMRRVPEMKDTTSLNGPILVK